MINLPEMFYQPDNDKIWMKDGRRYVPYRKGAASLDLSMSMSYPVRSLPNSLPRPIKTMSWTW